MRARLTECPNAGECRSSVGEDAPTLFEHTELVFGIRSVSREGIERRAGNALGSSSVVAQAGHRNDSGARRVVWSKGDRVVHAAKPEWGVGHVLACELVAGGAFQRLTVRFERGGTKAISTEFAELKAAGAMPLRTEPGPAQGQEERDGMNSALTQSEIKSIMTRLPERATDPFTPLAKRLAATLDLYRYGENNTLLLDWAAMQTGLKDPLSRFNRHELEEWFGRFRFDLDEHLKKLLRDMRREDAATLRTMVVAANPAAKSALRRVDTGR